MKNQSRGSFADSSRHGGREEATSMPRTHGVSVLEK
jgi:hypothetical protein